MVDETQTSVAFWDSLHFLSAYRQLSVEYLERIVRREMLDRCGNLHSTSAVAA